jgi:hypothetical protein
MPAQSLSILVYVMMNDDLSLRGHPWRRRATHCVRTSHLSLRRAERGSNLHDCQRRLLRYAVIFSLSVCGLTHRQTVPATPYEPETVNVAMGTPSALVRVSSLPSI